MGKAVGHKPHAGHQLFVARQHVIQLRGKPVELIPASIGNDSTGKVAADHSACGRTDRIRAGQKSSREKPPA